MAAAVAAAVKKRNEREVQREEQRIQDIAAGKAVDVTPKPEAPNLPPQGTGIWKFQRQFAIVYTNSKVQWFVAGLIGANFVANIIEKWIDPRGDKHPAFWAVLSAFFNISFLIELIVNMYGFWFWRFWKSGWNIFDFIVVVIGMLSTAQVPLPGPLSLLRMMRAFRVFRLFKRIKSLNKIIVSLVKAMPGVANAFFILTLVMAIYAILGVEFFRTFGEDGTYRNEFNETVALVTSRDMMYGDEYFGNFGRSLYTMFQVLTGDSWSEAIGRPLLHTTDVSQALGVSMFFVSFNLVNGVVLINVVIAVLLEKMVDNEDDKKQTQTVPDEEKEKAEQEGAEVPCTNGKSATPQSGSSGSTSDGAEALDSCSLQKIVAMETEFASLKSGMSSVKAQMEQLTALVNAYKAR